jgi:hypothetical protein
LALPGAEQKRHFDSIDVRVRNKVFASFPHPDQMTVRLEPVHARILMESYPGTYIPHPGVWGQRGWIRVTPSRIEPDALADLVHDSWRRVAYDRPLPAVQD